MLIRIDMNKPNAYVKRAALVLAFAIALGFFLSTLPPFNFIIFILVDILSMVFCISAIKKHKDHTTSSGKFIAIGILLLDIALAFYVIPFIF